MNYVCCALIGYLVGAINPSYFIAKIRGFDIRTKGSGNAGASNALILFGKAVGVLCAIFDIAKAYLAIRLAGALFPEVNLVFAITGAACVMGHIFPFYMRFKGGKGLACLGGMILCFNWKVFLLMLGGEVILALVADYICVVPLTASIAFPFVYGFMKKDIIGAFILVSVPVVIIFRHIENLKRIRKGTEMHLSYLWKPKDEIERIKSNLTEEDEAIKDRFSGDANSK